MFSKTRFIQLALFVALAAWLPSTVFAWNDCPFGMVNDPYPGKCGRYVDTNENGICDHSEPEPTDVDKGSNADIDSESEQVPTRSAAASEGLVNVYQHKEKATAADWFKFAVLAVPPVSLAIFVVFVRRKDKRKHD